MKHRSIRIALGLLVVAAFMLHATRIVEFGFLQRLEAIGYDARLRLTMPQTGFPGLVIVDIDEKSLAEEGRWPWGRDRLAVLVDKLFDRHQAAVIGFDVVFAEKDESSGLKVLHRLADNQLRDVPAYRSTLAELAPALDHDRLFAQQLHERPVLLGYYFTSPDDAAAVRASGMLPSPLFPAGTFEGMRVPALTATGYGANLAELQQAAAGAGHFLPWPDFDGVTRRIPLLVEYRGAHYESLSLAVVRTLLGVEQVVPVIPQAGNGAAAYSPIERLRLGALEIPVDMYVRALVPYRGKQGSFRYVSATDILHDRIAPAELADKIVLVGTTAPGLLDLRSSPVANVYPGVEMHANMIAGILEQNLKYEPDYLLALEAAALLLQGLLLAFLLPRLNPPKALLATAVVFALALGANLAAWQYASMALPVVSSLLLILMLYALNTAYGFFVEARAKRQMSDLFGQYVPPELVNEMGKNPQGFDMKGESREMSVLFADIRDFTSLSEKLDPQQLAALMNAYLTRMTQVIHKHRGTIDKYIGDAVMAFWGAPLHDPEHARHALLAGLEMQGALPELMAEFRAKGWPELKIGVGVNTGVMSVGNMGSSFRRAYTVMGDSVNLASRLEGLTRHYGVAMIVGPQTQQAAPDFVFRELDRVRVKGRNEPVGIYEPLGPAAELPQEVLRDDEMFQRALNHYRAGEWDAAESLLAELQQAHPDDVLYGLYRRRIGQFRLDPPPAGWDGVFGFDTK